MRPIRGHELRREEVVPTIRWLAEEVAPEFYQKGYQSFLRAWQTSGDLERDQYLSRKQPWYRWIHELAERDYDLDKIPERQVLFGVERTAADAIKLKTILSETSMDAAIRNELLARLFSVTNGAPALFELDMAFHYWRTGAELTWLGTASSHCEFEVTHPDLRFLVECKHLDEDSSQAVSRRHFYRLCDRLLKSLKSLTVGGHVELRLKAGLPSSLEETQSVASFLARRIELGLPSEHEVLPDNLGEAHFKLYQAGGVLVDAPERFARQFGPPNSLRIVVLREGGLSPLVFSVVSEAEGRIYKRLYRVFKDARRQIPSDGRGVINLYYDNLQPRELSRFKSVERFNDFNYRLLSQKESAHIMGLCYVSGPFDGVGLTGGIGHEALQYKNPHVDTPNGLSFIFD